MSKYFTIISFTTNDGSWYKKLMIQGNDGRIFQLNGIKKKHEN